MFEKSFKLLNFSLTGRYPKLTVLFHFGAQFTSGKPKILLKTKTFAKPTSLGISNSVRVSSQKNDRILVRLKKKIFFWPKLGLNCPLWRQHQKVIRNSHIDYNRKNSSTRSGCQVLDSVYLPFLTLPRRSTTFLV